MATSSHTTTVTAPGIGTGLVTNVKVTQTGDDVIQASHLGQADGDPAYNVPSPFLGTTEVSISYIGDSIPTAGDTGAVTVTGAVSVSLANAVCTGSSVTGSVGELITADATFTLISS